MKAIHPWKLVFLVVSLFKCLHFINAEHSSLIFLKGSTCRKYFLKIVSEKKPFLRPDMRKCLKPFLVYLFFRFFYLTNFSIINIWWNALTYVCSHGLFLLKYNFTCMLAEHSFPSPPWPPLSLSNVFVFFTIGQ